MTIQENTVCSLIQTFPVLLILAQKQNRCLETHFVYKPPTPTQSPEYYQALDALFQNLYGHGYPGHETPCYYSSKYGTKPCHGYPDHYGSHGVAYASPGTGYASHGIGYASHGTRYGSHGTTYGSHGYGHGSHGSHGVYYVPSYKKGNMYSGNITYGHGYASTQSYTANNKYKVVVKKTKIGSRSKKKSGKLQAGGERCIAVNQGEGECVELRSCQPLMDVLRRSTRSLATLLLQQAHCGFNGNEPMVCCPIEDQNDDKSNQINSVTQNNLNNEEITTALPPTTSTLPPTTSTLPPTTLPPTTLPATTLPSSPDSVVSTRRSKLPKTNVSIFDYVETCTTVYNTRGSCKDVYLCEPFLPLLKQVKTNTAAVIMLQKSACGFRGTIAQVCCPLPSQYTSNQAQETTTTPSPTSSQGEDFLPALLEPPVCGLSNISLNRVVGGIPAKLGAFPWMALLGYTDLSLSGGVRWNCGGSLVSTRHVLTAAHCIHNLEDDLIKVRLGELDIARDDDGATPIDVPIKTMYKHELYTKNVPVLYDVGILVLARNVEFTDLIKPICLFTASSSMWKSETFEDYNPLLAGWGSVAFKGISASHLQVAQLPVLGSEQCERAYSNFIAARELFSKQAMCAGYPGGKIDSCSGDSGGPLMQPITVKNLTPRTYMFAIGVVSFGQKCAQAGWPGVYARVSFYMPWIEEKMLGRAS